MTESNETRPGMTAALNGLVEGTLLFLILGMIGVLILGHSLDRSWLHLAALALAGGLIWALGKGLTGKLLGAVLGSAIGACLGGVAGQFLPAMQVPPLLRPLDSDGQPIELSGPGLDGKQVDLASYRGKVVLVDFWATWCLPCREEIPNILAAYQKYHDEGFEVIAISGDNDRVKLREFVEANKLPWPQIFFEEQTTPGAISPLAQKFKVEYYPTTLLIDGKGKVARRNVRGAELEREVALLLGKKAEPASTRTWLARVMQDFSLHIYLAILGGSVLGALAGALIQRRTVVRRPI